MHLPVRLSGVAFGVADQNVGARRRRGADVEDVPTLDVGDLPAEEFGVGRDGGRDEAGEGEKRDAAHGSVSLFLRHIRARRLNRN